MNQKRLTLWLVATILVLVGLLPVLSMLVESLMPNGHLSLEAYRGILTSGRQWMLMGNSIALALCVTFLTVVIGVPVGVLLGKTDLPMRGLFAGLLMVPLMIPPYIMAVSWSDLVGPAGLLATVMPRLAALASGFLFGFWGCVLVLFSIFLPIPMLLTMVFLRTVEPRLEEAGLTMTNWGKVLRRITLPLILPGITLAAIIVFLLTLGEFSVPNFLRVKVFAVESFTQFSAFYNFEAATAAAVPLAAIALLLLAVEGMFLRDKTRQLRLLRGETTTIPLGRSRNWLVLTVGLLVCITVLLPLSALVKASIGAYSEALARAGDSLLRSLGYAVVGATLLTVLGFFTGYLVHNRALICWRYVDSLTLFLFGLPGTVIGIGLISLWNRPWANMIYGTPAIIIVGYLAKYLALTNRISVAQLALIPYSMEEAAQVLGAKWLKRIGRIVAPLARPGLAACWLVGYVFTLRDTGITMLVYPPGHETLPVRIYTLMANGSPQLIAAMCVIMIAATLIPSGLFLFARVKR